MNYSEIVNSPSEQLATNEFFNSRLAKAAVSEETEQRLGSFAASLETHLRVYCAILRQSGTKDRERIDVHINNLIFQLDSDVRKVRHDPEASAKVWGTAMEKIITELAEVPYTFPSERATNTETAVTEDDADDGDNFVTVGRGEAASLSRAHDDAAVYKTWRRYLASTEAAAFPPLTADSDGGGDAPVTSERDFVAAALYARWEAAFELVDCLTRTEHQGNYILPMMAYVDLLAATVRQMLCFAAGTARDEAAHKEALRGPRGDSHREKLLQEVAENLLFFHQVWWWWKTKLQLVREKIETFDAVQGNVDRQKGSEATAAHDAVVAQWREAVADAEKAAEAVVAATKEDTTAAAVAVLQHDIALALASPSSHACENVQVSCRVITRAISFFLRSLPGAFYASPCGASIRSERTAEATVEYLREIMRDALAPTAQGALENAEAWLTADDAAGGEQATPSKRGALRLIVRYVEHYWGEELTARDDIVQTLKRL